MEGTEASEDVCIEGLPLDTTVERLKAIFMQYGDVMSCRLLDVVPGKSDLVAVIRMSCDEEAEWICENMHTNAPVGLTAPVVARYWSKVRKEHEVHMAVAPPPMPVNVPEVPVAVPSTMVAPTDVSVTSAVARPGVAPPGGIQTGVMMRGTVKRWDSQKGFGFIVPDGGGPDVFVHVKELTDGEVLVNGAQVMFEAVLDAAKGPGRYRAKTCVGALAKESVSGAVGASDRMFVVGLPLDITEDLIAAVFNQYGSVLSVKKLPSQAGKQDAAALVRMADVVQSQWIVENVSHNIPTGLSTPVTITYAENKPGGKGYQGGPVPAAPLVPSSGAAFGKALGPQALLPSPALMGPYGAVSNTGSTVQLAAALAVSQLQAGQPQVGQPQGFGAVLPGLAVSAGTLPAATALPIAAALPPATAGLAMRADGMFPEAPMFPGMPVVGPAALGATPASGFAPPALPAA